MIMMKALGTSYILITNYENNKGSRLQWQDKINHAFDMRTIIILWF